jgi:hypothetical protein
MGDVSVIEDRFVTAPRDPTGAPASAVGYETVGAEPRDHRGLPSPFLIGTSPSGWIAEEFPNIQAGGHRYARDWES